MGVMLIISVLSALLVMLIGLVTLFQGYRDLKGRRAFVDEYLSKFQVFVETCGADLDKELYRWLNHRVSRIQKELGVRGVVQYKPPFANYMFSSYVLIPETLSLMRSQRAHFADIERCEDILVRHLGRLDDQLESFAKELHNPFSWLQQGVRLVLSSPLLAVQWAGLAQPSHVQRVIESPLFKLLERVAVIITIAPVCWRFLELVNSFLRSLF